MGGKAFGGVPMVREETSTDECRARFLPGRLIPTVGPLQQILLDRLLVIYAVVLPSEGRCRMMYESADATLPTCIIGAASALLSSGVLFLPG